MITGLSHVNTDIFDPTGKDSMLSSLESRILTQFSTMRL